MIFKQTKKKLKKGPLGAGLRAKDYTSVTQTWPGFLERPLNVFFPSISLESDVDIESFCCCCFF